MPTFPGIVRAAGIIWVIIGPPMLLVTVGLFLLTITVGGGVGGAGLILMLVTILDGVFGGVFLNAGVTTVRGTANATLGNGIGSVVFGVPLGGLSLSLNRGTAGVALLVAGILALAGRRKYQAWQTGRDRPRRSSRVPG